MRLAVAGGLRKTPEQTAVQTSRGKDRGQGAK